MRVPEPQELMERPYLSETGNSRHYLEHTPYPAGSGHGHGDPAHVETAFWGSGALAPAGCGAEPREEILSHF